MPDWFYRTVSRPVLFQLAPRVAHNFTLKFMGALSRLPLGANVIDFLGHMAPPAPLRKNALGVVFPTSIGVGSWLDGDAQALPALARFGFGFLDIGPISLATTGENACLERDISAQTLRFSASRGWSLETLRPRIQEAAKLGLPIIVQLHSPEASGENATRELQKLMRDLAALATVFVVSPTDSDAENWRAQVGGLVETVRTLSIPRPLLLRIDEETDDAQIEIALRAGFDGLQMSGARRDQNGDYIVGARSENEGLNAEHRVLDVATMRRLRAKWPQVFLIGAGGVHQPQDALALFAAGADLVQLDSGLVFGGPGLPKRVNEALLCELLPRAGAPNHTVFEADETAERAPAMTWFWTLLMGLGMLFGSALTLAIAATRVLLPYDEAFLGMSRVQLNALNPQLLPFMMHDRVTLAGTMVALGVLYVGLSLGGIRRGLHWAQKTVFVSAFTGFGSFFFFLGFGYLDTLHAFVTSCLLQLLLLGVHSKLGVPQNDAQPCLRDDGAWRRALWGQLLMVGHGAALLVAGLAISSIGVTHVFTPHDLEFLRTNIQALQNANPHLVPLVAHDRATLGGMLLSSGWAFLLPALWGFRRGRAWLWWTFLVAGSCAYVSAIGVHLWVGYQEFAHLAPALAGFVLLLISLALSRSYLCAPESESGTSSTQCSVSTQNPPVLTH